MSENAGEWLRIDQSVYSWLVSIPYLRWRLSEDMRFKLLLIIHLFSPDARILI